MKSNKLQFCVVLAVFALASLACSIQLTNTPAAPTQALQATVQPQVTLPPVQTPSSPTTQAPNPSAVTPPSGILVDPGDGYGITLYNASGQSITELKAPNTSGYYTGDVHMAGPISGQILTPLVFLSWNGSTRAIMFNVNDAITQVKASNDLYQLKGADGQNMIVFVEVSWPSSGSGLDNKVYFGSVESLTGVAAPSFSLHDADMLAITPLAVKADNGQFQGFFYSRMPYGIGGDIVFSPQRGLYYYNAITSSKSEVISDTRIAAGISPDMTWAATTAYSSANQDLKLHNLSTQAVIQLPIESTSDRGAGDLIFSPDNHFIAWMEASGYRMAETPDFKSLVKVGDTSGTIIGNIPASSFTSVVGATADLVQPVGFLDDQNFLVQVYAADPAKTVIVKVSAVTGQVTQFCSGQFLGFYYPAPQVP